MVLDIVGPFNNQRSSRFFVIIFLLCVTSIHRGALCTHLCVLSNISLLVHGLLSFFRKRRRLETVVSPDLIPPSSATYTHAVTGNPSNVARSDQLDFNLGRFTRLTRSRWGPVESPNKLVNGQKSPPQMIDSARSVRSPLVPLHIFNCSGQVGANGVAQYRYFFVVVVLHTAALYEI